MSRFNEPKSPLTSARMFDKTSDAELADWLDTDAQAMDGQPGRNNHVAATRAAAERLRRLAEHDAKVRAESYQRILDAANVDERSSVILAAVKGIARDGIRGEPSDATLKESAPDLTRPDDMRSDVAYPSDAEVEAAARGAYDRAFLKHAPEDVDRWDDLVVDNDEAAESWREVARAALLAAQEVRPG
ncbi:hypothetical protein GCM10010910_01130 [Microbacterium nanhaiense]|uniref:Uncharacterized protein n=1 Tax=Microbacterium nanhaiense TaxID=1301026 RepID=A0ABQ2MW88_9MICO|nr:hypothetical protein [Microbacterium nanhaiense]GGO59069.1 hypothetical protein GCM10010910_01130 [Microbacterium nanhaiense]